MFELEPVQAFAVWVLPVLLAVTLHEAAHGWSAWKLGDPTAKELGRLSLNPIRHIDPVGTVILPGLMLLLGSPVLFGWAKPVPVDMRRLRKPRRDMGLVAAAGPAANLLMAFFWAGILKAGGMLDSDYLNYTGLAGIIINIALMILNLLPIPPLDGGRVLHSLLPEPQAAVFRKIEPYGLLIVLGLLAFDLLDYIMQPALAAGIDLMIFIFGL